MSFATRLTYQGTVRDLYSVFSSNLSEIKALVVPFSGEYCFLVTEDMTLFNVLSHALPHYTLTLSHAIRLVEEFPSVHVLQDRMCAADALTKVYLHDDEKTGSNMHFVINLSLNEGLAIVD